MLEMGTDGLRLWQARLRLYQEVYKELALLWYNDLHDGIDKLLHMVKIIAYYIQVARENNKFYDNVVAFAKACIQSFI